MINLTEKARETAEKMGQGKNFAYILSALNEAVKDYQLLREPTYSPLYEVLESDQTEKNIKDLIKKWHLSLRQEIGSIRGDLTVAYLRGVDAGKALKD